MRLIHILLCLAVVTVSAFASNHDLYFRLSESTGKFVVKTANDSPVWKSADGQIISDAYGDNVRIRVIDPPKSDAPFGFDLQRPFLVLDGIHLDPEENRTLSDYMDEVDEFGLVALLKELGYTPILVQFSETVKKSLEENSILFKNLLQFMNDNTSFGFLDKASDGFIVMGISQGGILGRYGSYLYDISRTAGSAPIRMYASLDSPHQGAVVPNGLMHTVNFWASRSDAAAKFKDMLEGPGASELLLYKKFERGDSVFSAVFYTLAGDSSRFLFGKYRDAANYKGFPAVLISQGQMKGTSPVHSDLFYDLSRSAKHDGVVYGRASSRYYTADFTMDTLAYNRKYRYGKSDIAQTALGSSDYDFVQGSTYPFAKTIYKSLRNGFESKIPEKFKVHAYLWVYYTMHGSWDRDTLYQPSSTFIPTASAMDMLCDGQLSIGVPCSFNESYQGFPFENPGNRSTADAVYAVDGTHPRFSEAMSGRHIETPGYGEKQDTMVLAGMQTDMWRILCEVAKRDYDLTSRNYRNPKLAGVFDPTASCMDVSKMPYSIRNSGRVLRKKFGYARYDYSERTSEHNDSCHFELPAGWHKVAVFDNGEKIQEGTTFEVDVRAKEDTLGWMKAELLLTTTKAGTGQVQLQEITIPMDGKSHTVRWTMPEAENALKNYRWFRLVLNSSKTTVDVLRPRLVYTSLSKQSVEYLTDPIIFPNSKVPVYAVGDSTSVGLYSDAIGSGQDIRFGNIGDFVFYNFEKAKNMSQFSNVKVQYWAGSCSATKVYFDSYVNGAASLADGAPAGLFVEKSIPLENIVNKNFTQDNDISATRFVLRGTKPNERCLIHSIILE